MKQLFKIKNVFFAAIFLVTVFQSYQNLLQRKCFCVSDDRASKLDRNILTVMKKSNKWEG